MPAYFGLDIGSYSIKAVQAERRGTGWRLEALGEIKTPSTLKLLTELDKRNIASAIKKMITDAKITSKEVALSLPENMAYSQVIEMPYLTEEELRSAITFEAEQYIPVPLEEVQLEYLVLSPPQKGTNVKTMSVLLIAGQKTAINNLLNIVELSGLTPALIETQALSLIRTVNLNYKGNLLVLDLGHTSSNIIILQNQNLKLIRTLGISGEAFTRAIAKDLNMEYLQAEQYKQVYGLDDSVLEGKVAKAIFPVFTLILNELKNTLNFFYQKHPGEAIKSIVVSGGGAMLRGINSHLANSLNLEVATLDPFKSFKQDQFLSQIKKRANFSTAVGLAIRED